MSAIPVIGFAECRLGEHKNAAAVVAAVKGIVKKTVWEQHQKKNKKKRNPARRQAQIFGCAGEAK